MKQKVFCIGFHKTGTTSLGKLLEKLGYNNCHGAGPIRKALGDNRMMELLFKRDYKVVFDVAEEYDSFNDNPWFSLYQELDVRFPNSKFILVERDESKWIASCIKYFGKSKSAFRMFLYGKSSPEGNEERYLQVYNKHNDNVKSYFKERKDDLLVVDLEDDVKLEKIVKFLNIDVSISEFPHLIPKR